MRTLRDIRALGCPHNRTSGRTRCGRAGRAIHSQPAPKEQASPPISQVRVPHRTGHSEKWFQRWSPAEGESADRTPGVKLSGTDDRGGVPLGTRARRENSPMTDPTERLSPLHDIHVAAGAAFTDFAGWQMPVRYSSDLAEHAAVRSAAGLFDLSHMGEILVVGPQAAEALDYALAGKLSAIEEGQAKYSLLLERRGRHPRRPRRLPHRRRPLPGRRQRVQPRGRGPRAARARLRVRLPGRGRERRHRADRAPGPEGRGDPAQRRGLRPRVPAQTGGLDDLKYYRAIPCDFRGRTTCWSLAPGTPARTVSSSTSPRMPLPRSGRRSPRRVRGRASFPPASPPATPCASRRACRSTGTSSAPRPSRCRPGSAASSR